MLVFSSVKRNSAVAFISLACVFSAAAAAERISPSDFVDTQIERGFLFRGANVPFGMIMWGPSKKGFSLTALSGAEMPEYYSNDVPILPTVVSPNERLMAISENSGEPGYLKSILKDGVVAEFTTTTRAGIARFTFPHTKSASIIFNIGNGDGFSILNFKELKGSTKRGPFLFYKSRNVYFYVEFDRPFRASGRSFVTFDTSFDTTVHMKIGMSHTSARNAKLNLDAELPSWNFDETRVQAKSLWNKMLSRIEVEGGTLQEKKLLYTSLYHVLFHPNVFSDVNGEYIGFDGKTHRATDYVHYANFSGWDIYRSWVQLVAMIYSDETSDMMHSLVKDAQQSAPGGGTMPRWAAYARETGVMEGGSATPIVASAYAFGARDFDVSGAMAAIDLAETKAGAACQGFEARPYLDQYLSLGYVPYGHENRFSRQAASITLEYATRDFAASQFSKALGYVEKSDEYLRRSTLWRKLFNTETGYIQPRYANGNWMELEDPIHGHLKGYTEAGAIQQVWMVPHDQNALFDLMGGNEKAISRLDEFFTKLNDGWESPFSWIGNEHCFLTPWQYNWAGAPWKTQEVVRRMITEVALQYFPGADDLGSMSSWQIWAMLGIYPALPGVGGFTVASPIFPKAVLHLSNNRKLTISGNGADAGTPYVQELRVNQKKHESTWVGLEELQNDQALLEFVLSKTPNRNWGK